METKHSHARARLPHGASLDYDLSREGFDALGRFDTCTVANAIERLQVRLRNEGFTKPGLRCVTGGFPRVLGYAATCKVRTADPPFTGDYYLERSDWWNALDRLPVPRIAVIQDLDTRSGSGSSVGEVHAAILKAFRCVGVVTNGAVRDVPGVAAMQFPMFAASMAVSHSYMHLVEYGGEVEIFGLKIRPGDLLLADCHGVLSIPKDVAAALPGIASQIRANERRIIELCEAPDFSPETLRDAIRDAR